MSVQKKIAELLAESQDHQTLDETAASETIKTKAPASGGDNEDNKKNQGIEKPAVSTSKDSSKAGSGGAGSQASEIGGMKQEAYDSSADVAALIEGEELSEEFKTKAATIFEAAVVTRVKAEIASIQEAYDAQLVEEFALIKEELVEKVDGYLGYVTEQWMKQNEIALESGIKSELAESFIDSIKKVFEDHYVDVPAEKYDVLGSLGDKVDELESKLNESVNANIEMSKQIAEMERANIVSELSEGLTDTESEKFASLASEIVCEDVDTLQSKLQTIRESYFKAPVASATQESDDTDPASSEQMISESVAHLSLIHI
jgi:hypothetical protein